MKAYRKELGLGLIIVVCLSVLVWKVTRPTPEPEAPGLPPCGTERETLVMQDEWMSGTLEKNTEFEALMDWHACHKLVRGDLVLYRVSKSHDPVVLKVAGIPGDTFKLKKDENRNSWNIEINGETLMEGGKPYHFGSANPPALKLYQDAQKGLLDKSSVLIFSTKSPGEQDSGSLGVLSTNDIVGLVTPSQ